MSPTSSGSGSSGPSDAEIQAAARLIREGGLVAFPTETVYGLGANALDVRAVSKIFEAKRRPSTSPLIVHVSSVEQARGLVSAWPNAASVLTARFWPGPLTLVLPKHQSIPDVVTAGLPTVGLRMPDHPVALALIEAAGVPIAAPSANIFTELSPTRTGHLSGRLLERAGLVLEGGATPVGIESTVLSLSDDRSILLRPGMISRDEIESLIGPVSEPAEIGPSHPSPGMHERHYAPATPLHLTSAAAPPPQGRGVYLHLTKPAGGMKCIAMPRGPAKYAARLYDVLHALDAEGWDWIAVETPPNEDAWAGILDRLRRASHGRRR